MTLYDHLIVLVFAGLYPTYVYFGYRKIQKDLLANKPGVRLADYKETSVWLWALAFLALVNWVFHDRAFGDLGLNFSLSWSLLATVLLCAITPFLLFSQFRKGSGDEAQRETLRAKLADIAMSEFLPRSKKEFQWFVVLSLSAGICEEILFRGFLFWYFQELSSMILAVIASAVLFGLAHSYQGRVGMSRSGIMGAVFAVIYVLTDSLWIPIFLHTVGDIYSGMLGWLAYGKENEWATGR